jgi:hypothetical protein
VSHTCEATFGVPGRGGKGRGGARESRKRGVATDADYRLFRYWTRSLLLLVKWV